MVNHKSVLLIGLGRFGRNIAMKLNDLGHQVLAVDTREDRVNEVLPYVTGALIGDGTKVEFLATLGVPDFDVCVVAIGDDFQGSLETAWQLREFGAKRVIARASRTSQEKFLLQNGADEVVYPERQLAEWTALRCSSDLVIDYRELAGDYAIYELAVPRALCGRPLDELDVRARFGINVLGVRRGGELDLDITPQTVFDEGESVLVLGRERSVRACFGV